MIYIYFSAWDDEYFLSKTEIKEGFLLIRLTQNEKDAHEILKSLGANKEIIDKMFEEITEREMKIPLEIQQK